MELAARTAVWAKSGDWVNPYVTDGLIAMWDGEWNAGGGLHVESSDHIVELVSGAMCEIVGNVGLANKSLEFSGDGWIDCSSVGYMNYQFYEVCMAVNDITKNMLIVDFSHTSDIAFGTYESTLICSSRLNKFGALRYVPKSFTGTFYNDTKDCQAWVNGERQNTYLNNDRWVNANDFGVIGARANIVRSVYFDGKIYSIRIYENALTEEQIAANYAIDKERFNLP